MPTRVFSAVRDLSRLREISSVLIRHGLGDVVRRAGVAPLLERAGQILHWGESADAARLEPQQRMAAGVPEAPVQAPGRAPPNEVRRHYGTRP